MKSFVMETIFLLFHIGSLICKFSIKLVLKLTLTNITNAYIRKLLLNNNYKVRKYYPLRKTKTFSSQPM